MILWKYIPCAAAGTWTKVQLDLPTALDTVRPTMNSAAPLLAVVDDDADVRVALTRLVASAGFAVEAFASGRGVSALRSANQKPDCVVLDLHMPEMSGFEVHRRAR